MEHKENYEFCNNFLTAYKENILMKRNPNLEFEFDANNVKYKAILGTCDIFDPGMCKLLIYIDNKLIDEKYYNIFDNFVITRKNKNTINVNSFTANLQSMNLSPYTTTVIKIDNDYYHIHKNENVTKNIEKVTKNFFKNKLTLKNTHNYNYIPIFAITCLVTKISRHISFLENMINTDFIMHLKLSI